ncbi:pectin methyl esterase [Diplocarpon rosae]|nr:pectin methyl esterase [Diplocarpon rosae]
MRFAIAFGLLISLVAAVPNIEKKDLAPKVPKDAVIVDASGAQAGSFTTLQAAVNSLSLNTTKTQSIYIHAGVYNEQVYIPPLLSNLVVQGETNDSSSYHGNKVTVINNISRNTVPNNDLTATIRNWSNNTKFYNLNIENNFGHTPKNGQNLAISANATNQGYYGVQFIGYQDTILAQTGNQLYAKCLIVGVVDFIFGQRSHAWFEQVDIRTFAKGYIVASGGVTPGASKYVINHSTVAALNSSVKTNSTFLGRPWKAYAYTVFQNSDISDVVNPLGWSPWNAATPNTNASTLAEFNNTGAGAAGVNGQRAEFAKTLKKAIKIEKILGSDYEDDWYVDTKYM